jgi:peptidoglycan biosynthesis protein MviN/MurJ (putative lipid II flippase)
VIANGARAEVRPTAQHEPVYRNTAWTAASQLATMALGAGVGIILLVRFGKSAQTDAAFVSYGAYSALLILCLGFRVSVVPRLTQFSSSFRGLDHFLGAGMSLLLVVAIVFVVFGDWVAALLAGGLGPEAQQTVRESLALLTLALAAQLVGALGAAVLGIHGEFAAPAVAYVLGALTSLGCVLVLPITMGVLALPSGILAGSLLLAAVIMLRVIQLGYTLSPGTVFEGARELHTLVLLVVASLSPLAWQLNYLISLGFAARLGTGAVTLYTYAFSAAGIVTGVTASAASFVLAGRLSQTWDRRSESLAPYLETMIRVGLLIVVPILAVAALAGEEIIELLLGRSLTRSDAHTIVITFLSLAGLIVATMSVQVPLLAAYARSHYGRVAALLILVSGLHVALSTFAYEMGEIPLLGMAATISSVTALVLVLGATYERDMLRPLVFLGRELVQLTMLSLAAFAPCWIIANVLGDNLWDLPCAIAGIALFAAFLHVWFPAHYRLATYIASQVFGVARVGRTDGKVSV